GIYSSEWYWAKLLHVSRRDEKVRKPSYTWEEHSDWMPALLTGIRDAQKIKRNVCAAGHKALWASEFNGLPPKEFFQSVDPLFEPFVRHYGSKVFTAAESAGQLSEEWASRLGL